MSTRNLPGALPGGDERQLHRVIADDERRARVGEVTHARITRDSRASTRAEHARHGRSGGGRVDRTVEIDGERAPAEIAQDAALTLQRVGLRREAQQQVGLPAGQGLGKPGHLHRHAAGQSFRLGHRGVVDHARRAERAALERAVRRIGQHATVELVVGCVAGEQPHAGGVDRARIEQIVEAQHQRRVARHRRPRRELGRIESLVVDRLQAVERRAQRLMEAGARGRIQDVQLGRAIEAVGVEPVVLRGELEQRVDHRVAHHQVALPRARVEVVDVDQAPPGDAEQAQRRRLAALVGFGDEAQPGVWIGEQGAGSDGVRVRRTAAVATAARAQETARDQCGGAKVKVACHVRVLESGGASAPFRCT